MGACPYCRSATLPSDTICYSCGRVLPKGDRGSYRLEQQFAKKKGKKETTYLMANKPSRRGVVQTHTGRQRNIMKRRKNRFRSFAMLGLVAFVMLSPQAQEAVFGEFGGVEEFLQSQLLLTMSIPTRPATRCRKSPTYLQTVKPVRPKAS